MESDSFPATAAHRKPYRDTSWPIPIPTDTCTCGHPRREHAYPGPASTPCSRPYCTCPTFGVIRNGT